MKKTKVKWLIVSSFVLLAGCFNNGLGSNEFLVHDIELGDSQDEVDELLGTPNDQDTSIINENEYLTYEYENVEFILLDQTVVGIHSEDEEFETESGVHIGSERSSVEEVYQEKEHIKDAYGMMIKDGDILLHMIFNEDEVDSIRISTLNEMEDYLESDFGFDIYAAFENHTDDMKLVPLNPAEVMYDHLEAAGNLEEDIADMQVLLTEAETEEMEWYGEMLSLSSVEEIEPLADQGIESANNRRTIMEEEQTLMEESFITFQEAEAYANDVDEEVEKPHADELVNAMNDRYDTYQEFYEEYNQSISENIRLYEMLKDEEVELEDLQEQHESVNEGYTRLSELNDQFNQLTNDYNEAKLNFYEAAEFKE